jgi:hypothetical protein
MVSRLYDTVSSNPSSSLSSSVVFLFNQYDNRHLLLNADQRWEGDGKRFTCQLFSILFDDRMAHNSKQSIAECEEVLQMWLGRKLP